MNEKRYLPIDEIGRKKRERKWRQTASWRQLWSDTHTHSVEIPFRVRTLWIESKIGMLSCEWVRSKQSWLHDVTPNTNTNWAHFWSTNRKSKKRSPLSRIGDNYFNWCSHWNKCVRIPFREFIHPSFMVVTAIETCRIYANVIERNSISRFGRKPKIVCAYAVTTLRRRTRNMLGDVSFGTSLTDTSFGFFLSTFKHKGRCVAPPL